MSLFRFICSSLILLIFTLSAQAQIYQWRDEEGKLHYSDRAPKTAEVKEKNVSVPNVGFISPPKKPQETSNPKKENTPKPIKKDPVKCAQARESLPILQGNTRIRTNKGNGETAYLTIEEINEQIDLAQKIIDVHCE